MENDLQRCITLLKENEHDVRENAECALLAVCQNILSCPEEKKYREVRLDDPSVIEKLLPAVGAMECLFDVGFTEAGDCLFLPQEASLAKLKTLQTLLIKDSSVESYSSNSSESRELMPTPISKGNKFLVRIEETFKNTLRYEDPNLQDKARKLIPIMDLEIATISRMRELQRHIKLNQTSAKSNAKKEETNSNIDTRDVFLIELTHWYKHKFFTWVDSPKCPKCFNECRHEKVIASNDPKCSRIELYRCNNCGTLVKFPRYSDPDPLLTLRRGRCGEWANVFMLLCRSLGYDARLTCDETDHVWTEVWSLSEKRWIHIDPCENVIDRPLMYEKGWCKKLTYIIAYSKDEVQDVTWRYTQNQRAVMQRRNLCSEESLLQFIESLNRVRQTSVGYSTIRRQYVIKRRLLELIELLHMPHAQNHNDNESYEGRTTGSYAWRLARGEISEKSQKASYCWDISKHGQTFQLHYSITEDVYQVVDDNGSSLVRNSGWAEGAHVIEGGIFRKVENDWKMVYLSRSPGATYGKIKWMFDVTDPRYCISMFYLQALVTVFHGARVQWEIEAFFNRKEDQKKILLIPIDNCSNYQTNELKGALKLILTVSLSGGEGDVAWQHAQLFRQSLGNKDQSLIIKIELNDR